MPKHLYILLLLAAFVLVGCADESTSVPTAPTPSAPTAERAEVPLSFDATLSDEGPASRAAFTYGDLTSDPSGKKGLKVTWQEGDALGVYIKTAEGTILRAGSITTHTGGGKTRHFEGHALELFEGEHYIYMHPDIGREIYVNLEEMDGELGSTAHITDHLPIVWDVTDDSDSDHSPYVGSYKGYVIHLELDFQTTNPGLIRKVTLLTSSRGPSGLQEDRIFPRHYSINQLAKSSEIFDASQTSESQTSGTTLDGTATSNTDFTNAITLNVTSGTLKSEVRSDGKTYYSTDVYLTSSAVKNLNLYPTKFYVLVVGDRGMLFQSTPVSFNGQGKSSGSQLLSKDVLRNGIVGRVAATMSSGNISPTIINADYKIASILGMWNEYGKPYDPNGLVFYKTGPSSYNAGMPTVLVENGNAIHDRYILTNSTTGTPTFTWNLYESQCASATDHKQADVTCNNIDIVKIPDASKEKQGTEIFVSFLSEYAWNQNLLGYYHYPTPNQDANPAITVPGSATDVMKYIIFPNLSKPGHEPFNSNGQAKNNIGRNEDAPLEEYMTVKLVYQEDNGSYTTIFPPGTTIGFWGMIDVKANGFQQTQYSLLNWNQWRFFSNSAWNASNSNWTGNYTCYNFFASGDICETTGNTSSEANSTIIPGIAIYGFMDDVNKGGREKTAFSTCIFLVSAGNPAAMQTHNKACFNIGCTVPDKPTISNYPSNLVINK